jgi:hypothetical protein
VALSCGLLSVGLVLDSGPNARSGGATARLERERISKESLGATLGMWCDGRNDCLPAVRVASAAARNSMATVISIRMFQSTIRRLGIEKSWYRFREEALAEEGCLSPITWLHHQCGVSGRASGYCRPSGIQRLETWVDRFNTDSCSGMG